MYVKNLRDIEKVPMNMEGASAVMKQMAVGKDEGWKDHAMRVFTISEMGHTPKHAHEWPHINYIISGSGILHMNGEEFPVEQGDVAYVPEGIEHQFRSASGEDFVFICIVPEKGEY